MDIRHLGGGLDSDLRFRSNYPVLLMGDLSAVIASSASNDRAFHRGRCEVSHHHSVWWMSASK